MIYKHRFLKNDFFKEKCLKEVTIKSPLVLMVEKDQFLHFTFEKSLFFLQIPHEIICLSGQNVENERKTMDHQLPTLIFQNQVLETGQLIEFLCDAYLSDSNVLDFWSRKTLIKKLVKTWRQIFLLERHYPYKFEKLIDFGVSDKKTYQNLIFQELTMLYLYFQEGLLQRTYVAYFGSNIPLEIILFVDIINTILKTIPSTFVDYCLRTSFISLIQLKSKIQKTIDNKLLDKDKIMNHFVVIEQMHQPIQKAQLDYSRINWQKFLITFGVVSAIYSVFVQT